MAPDSADVDMDGEPFHSLQRTRSANHQRTFFCSKANWHTVARVDTEDEDTEQKIINEGMSHIPQSWT
jgi:hypothetical protein